ncbi:hypothetical protein E8E13_004288 [Curvularia kusanoi]|uniref:Uncharacterized protein n=1 Tax=Curvularia kusanoi TaxID=90978 RepID=A0A9P4W2Z5_CURKU|nr:hypothetical protein E8E13_004288 [Curvularia kusanoi]
MGANRQLEQTDDSSHQSTVSVFAPANESAPIGPPPPMPPPPYFKTHLIDPSSFKSAIDSKLDKPFVSLFRLSVRVLQVVFAFASGISYAIELSRGNGRGDASGSFVFSQVAFGTTIVVLIVNGVTVRYYRSSWIVDWILAVFWFALFAIFYEAYQGDGEDPAYGKDVSMQGGIGLTDDGVPRQAFDRKRRSRCVKGGRICPGYRNAVDLMFQDESAKVIRKSKGQLPKSASTSTTRQDEIAVQRSAPVDLSNIVVYQPWDDLSVNFFMSNYIGPDPAVSQLYYLPTFYAKSGYAASSLKRTIIATGLAGYAREFTHNNSQATFGTTSDPAAYISISEHTKAHLQKSASESTTIALAEEICATVPQLLSYSGYLDHFRSRTEHTLPTRTRSPVSSGSSAASSPPDPVLPGSEHDSPNTSTPSTSPAPSADSQFEQSFSSKRNTPTPSTSTIPPLIPHLDPASAYHMLLKLYDLTHITWLPASMMIWIRDRISWIEFHSDSFNVSRIREMVHQRPFDGFPVPKADGAIPPGGGICDTLAVTAVDQRLWFLTHSWLFVGLDWNADYYSNDKKKKPTHGAAEHEVASTSDNIPDRGVNTQGPTDQTSYKGDDKLATASEKPVWKEVGGGARLAWRDIMWPDGL